MYIAAVEFIHSKDHLLHCYTKYRVCTQLASRCHLYLETNVDRGGCDCETQQGANSTFEGCVEE